MNILYIEYRFQYTATLKCYQLLFQPTSNFSLRINQKFNKYKGTIICWHAEISSICVPLNKKKNVNINKYLQSW